MEIKNFIKIYDEILPWKVLSNLIRYSNVVKFEESRVGGGEHNRVDFNIRRTYVYGLTNLSNSMSLVHWHNLLYHYFKQTLLIYKNDLKIEDYSYKNISSLSLLKYENTGFYTCHVDHFAEHPRTMSCILLLNNDYEGGNICFRNPDGSGEWQVEVKPNRMILWPSNFLYPHMVKPVTKGIRYSVVAWAL